MLGIISKIWKNKIFFIFLALIVITLPSTIYKQSDKDKTIVTSSIGIDKKDDEYEVTILAVIPKGANDVNSNLELFSASDDTISSALDKISLDIGRKIGLAHCDCIIMSEEIMQSNMTEVLDYFIRTSNLSTNPTLVATPDSAKDLLDAVKSSNNLLDLSLKNIITSQEDRTLLNNVTLDRFYRAYFSQNSTFTIPIISTSEEKSESSSSSSSSGGESSNLQKDDESQGGSGSSGGQKKIKNDNKIAIIKNGQMISTLSEPEKFIYTLLVKPAEFQKFRIDNVNDEYVIDSTIIFQEADKIILPKYTFKDGKPVAKYSIWLSIMVDEVKSKTNHSFASVNGVQNYLTDTTKAKLQELVSNNLEITISKMRENGYDIMNLYEKFDAYEYRKFQEYLSTFDNPNDYMQDMTIEIDLKLNYVI